MNAMQTIMRRAAMSFAPASADDATRTVELVASTGAGVPRMDIDGPFLEVLQVSTTAVDLSRADGMPLLNSHDQSTLDSVLGVVRAVKFEAGQLIVKVEISARHDPIWADVKGGIIRNCSIGYQPVSWTDRDTPQGRVRTVSRWVLHEISMVPVGADPSAKTRSNPMTTEVLDPPVLATRAATNAEIRGLASTFGLGAAWSDNLIDRHATAEEARAAAMQEMQARAARPAPTVQVVADRTGDPASFVRHAAEALFVTRVSPRATVSPEARQYCGMTVLDLARAALAIRGVSTMGMSPADTITRSLGGLHTTSDFPAILGDVANRVLRESYAAAPAALRAAARQTTARDFRAKTSVALGEAPTLQRVNEHGEYESGTMAEAKESYRIDTYGRIIGISRKALVNDDLSAFVDLAGRFGTASADFEAQFLVDLLTAGSGLGPTMDDGQRLFHSAHGNVAASGAILSATTLSAARLAMRRQKGLSGRAISVQPKFLIVPPELETTAEQLLTAVNATTTEDVNVFGGKLSLLVEARLASTTRWYLSADPATVPGLEYSYLQGSEGPVTETRNGFEVDGVEVKVRLDFGAGFVDWRSWFTNAGA
jgi:HK97 family phage prohead protease